jgi:transcriptional regulator with XRE-family HTH domain
MRNDKDASLERMFSSCTYHLPEDRILNRGLQERMKNMILADKIMNERKRNGWSQEELAEKLAVSRQSVSKWEGAQAVPDLQRIIRMAEIFGVSTDYLLKDDIEIAAEAKGEIVEAESVPPMRKVSMEEAVGYLDFMEIYANRVANAVSMCILSPVILIFLAGLSEEKRFGISENLAAAVGIVVLFLLVAAAVFIFVTTGLKMKHYEYLDREAIETEYGIAGMVGEKKRNYENKYSVLIVTGVLLCIASPLPLIVASLANLGELVITTMVGVLLMMVATAVNLFVRAGSVNGSYDRLLQEGEFTLAQKEREKQKGNIASVYWSLVLAIYFIWSFVTMKWNITWIVWPIAGVLFGAVSAVTGMLIKDGR